MTLILDGLLSFCHSTRLSLQGPNVCHFYRAFYLTCQMFMSFSWFLYLDSHAMSSLKKKNKGDWIKQTVDIDLSSLQRKVIKGQIIISLMQFWIAPTINSLPWLSHYIEIWAIVFQVSCSIVRLNYLMNVIKAALFASCFSKYCLSHELFLLLLLLLLF